MQKPARIVRCSDMIRYKRRDSASIAAGICFVHTAVQFAVVLCSVCDGWHLIRR